MNQPRRCIPFCFSEINLRRLFVWCRVYALKVLFLIFGAYFVLEILAIPFWSISNLKTENPKESALMRQRVAEAKEEGKSLIISQRWVSLSQVPKHVRRAIIVAEDAAFYSHGGVDWDEVQASLETNLETGRAARGASTITQQLAKNLYLSTAKTPMRKMKELIVAYRMESPLSKNRILELYVNVIEWGHGVFGIEAAARRYFGKSARWLTRDEGARLAAVIPRPLLYRPNDNSRYVLKKKQLILRRMAQRGKK